MTIMFHGEKADAVMAAARAWRAARSAAISVPIERFDRDRKGDMIPSPNLNVWKALADAETALSEAVAAHVATDLVWPVGNEPLDPSLWGGGDNAK